MHRSLLPFLRDPGTGGPLSLEQMTLQEGAEVMEGGLHGENGKTYAICNGIPRFVQDDGYTENFGLQWNRYRLVQLDSRNGTHISRDRFHEGTGWRTDELAGKRVLEVGCGAGRFTEILLAAGAEVIAMDYSSAVDACAANHWPHPRLHILQADVFRLPIAPSSVEYVFCYGVLQHTPDPERAFRCLLPPLRPGGKIAADVYRRWVPSRRRPLPDRWQSKFLYRWLTKRLPPSLLRGIAEWYVPLWFPIDNAMRRIPVLRRIVPLLVPCWNYTGILPLSREQLVQWAILDTFDALSARYDFPQTIASVREWCSRTDLADVSIRRGGNGILLNARKPATEK
ncbi:MAG: 2-polyprenyl-3-methyl-5-hydroxy-6-metoxy-1,4-benzoquinol methylase [Candidatus Peregrinibacteria bacterium Greene0416_19]|nr:MAG: 2-polyprenyl-3-methyl-5-hydroxy-6-metoxy-1,4-benzoquinol methylase [Candidatus Peregrinibacteria bacterium Greene0416_19]